MTIHAAVSELKLRFFVDGSNIDVSRPIHEMTEEYQHFCVATINDRGVARIEGLTFRISHKERREIRNILGRYGARSVTWRHKGREKEFEI